VELSEQTEEQVETEVLLLLEIVEVVAQEVAELGD
jgi:hypothetical protein